jgi:hypothetical protein
MDSPPQQEQENEQQAQEQEEQAQPEPVAGSPSAFLRNIVGKKVVVRIGNGIDYHGTCSSGV